MPVDTVVGLRSRPTSVVDRPLRSPFTRDGLVGNDAPTRGSGPLPVNQPAPLGVARLWAGGTIKTNN